MASAHERDQLAQIKPGARVTPRSSCSAAAGSPGAGLIKPGELGIVQCLEDDGVQRFAVVRPAAGGGEAGRFLREHLAVAAAPPAADDGAAASLHELAGSTDGSRFADMVMVLDGGVAPDERDSAGRTALMLAAAAGNLQAARLLLWRGAKPGARDGAGRTPLQHALSGGGHPPWRTVGDPAALVLVQAHPSPKWPAPWSGGWAAYALTVDPNAAAAGTRRPGRAGRAAAGGCRRIAACRGRTAAGRGRRRWGGTGRRGRAVRQGSGSRAEGACRGAARARLRL